MTEINKDLLKSYEKLEKIRLQNNERSKRYYKKNLIIFSNKRKEAVRIICDCGGSYKDIACNKNQHIKTKMHNKYLKTINIKDENIL